MGALYTCASLAPTGQKTVSDPTGAGVRGGCELPWEGVRNAVQVLWISTFNYSSMVQCLLFLLTVEAHSVDFSWVGTPKSRLAFKSQRS